MRNLIQCGFTECPEIRTVTRFHCTQIVTIAFVKLQLNADVFRNAIKYFLSKKWKKNAILVRVSRIKFKTGWDKIYIFSRPAHPKVLQQLHSATWPSPLSPLRLLVNFQYLQYLEMSRLCLSCFSSTSQSNVCQIHLLSML